MLQRIQKCVLIGVMVVLAAALVVPQAAACTRILRASDGQTTIGRTMDWNEEMKTRLWVFPRGIKRNGLAGPNSLEWTAKYGSIMASAYDFASSDGLNEKGLHMALLWLSETDYGANDGTLPSVSVALWGQYVLDTFATVEEAVEGLAAVPIRPVAIVVGDEVSKVHLVLADASGDSAIIEYIKGKAIVYHGRGNVVVTNSPTYDKQLANLKRYRGLGGKKVIPGSEVPADRFVRAAYYRSRLPAPADARDAVYGMLSVMRNVSQPFARPDEEHPFVSPTIWRTVVDLKNRVYYYESTSSTNMIHADLTSFDLREGAPIRNLDLVKTPDLSGDVSRQFTVAAPMEFRSAMP